MVSEWLVFIQDHKDVGDKRITTLGAHLAGMEHDPKDRWALAGFSVAEHVKDVKNAKITGSAFIGRAPSKDIIESRIKNDALYINGVWNPETLLIIPFVSTVRESL